jgi:ribosomal protein S18 acetylase RimI-like enzyme
VGTRGVFSGLPHVPGSPHGRTRAGRGLAFLTLETGAANKPARDLYAALGYQEEGVRLTKAIARRPAEQGDR